MTIHAIMERCKSLQIEEQRAFSDEYSELVFFNKETDQWQSTFTELLGVPLKPHGIKPSKEMKKLTEEYGGIAKDQTLFKKEYDSCTMLAMFWPWQDTIHTTLKIVALQKS